MTPLPGAPAPGADDLEARLAAALNPELNHLVADAAALRAHARAGSRRIRRRRRVAAGALTVVALGGLSALALPRHQDPSPVPLPVATPTVTPTGVTTQPTPSGTPSGSPSLQVTSTPPPNSVSPTHTPTGTASGTQGTRTTTAPVGSSGPGHTTGSADPTRTGPVTVGDWMSIEQDTGYVLLDEGPLTSTDDTVTIMIPHYGTLSCARITPEGMVTGRYWEYDQSSSGYGSQTVTVWQKGRGRDALGRLPACFGTQGLIERTPDQFIEMSITTVSSDYFISEVHAARVVDDVLVAIELNRVQSFTIAEAKAYAEQVLDGVFARMKAKGVG